jgi:hypothetical protein
MVHASLLRADMIFLCVFCLCRCVRRSKMLCFVFCCESLLFLTRHRPSDCCVRVARCFMSDWCARSSCDLSVTVLVLFYDASVIVDLHVSS